MAALVRSEPSEVIFTSCGSESDNHAIHIAIARGKAALPKGVIPHIVTSNIEHPAIEACLDALEAKGEVTTTRVSVESVSQSNLPLLVMSALEFDSLLGNTAPRGWYRWVMYVRRCGRGRQCW